MKPYSVFLRMECILPERLDPLRKPVGEGWTLVEEITAPIFDTMIRRMGWHFLSMHRPDSRTGFEFTQEDAIKRTLMRVLNGVASRFNAAELDSVQITQYPGFQIANVTVQTLQIQRLLQCSIPARSGEISRVPPVHEGRALSHVSPVRTDIVQRISCADRITIEKRIGCLSPK